PFPSPVEAFPSLAEAAAKAAGTQLSEKPQKRWLRYYGELRADAPNPAWDAFSYTAVPTNSDFFRGRAVFIGGKPESADPAYPETDKFCTPYTSKNRQAVGGMEIMATTFLNLMNGDWLRRPPGWMEAFLLILCGALLGSLSLLRPAWA